MRITKKELLLFLTPLTVFIFVGAVIFWRKAHPTSVTAHIGPFSSEIIRERTALQTLSKQIDKFPFSQIYWIKERGKSGVEEDILFFKRDQNIPNLGKTGGILWVNLLNSPKSFSDSLYYWGVDDKTIHSIASKSGDFKDIQRAATILHSK
jgi:hypothetical protein